jgi:hypothetical protein
LVVTVFTHGDRQVVNKLFLDPGFSTKKKSIYNTHFKNFRHNDKFHRHNSNYSTLDTYEPGNTGNIKDKVVPVHAMNAYRGGDKQHESFLMSALD